MENYWSQFNDFYLFGLPRYTGAYPHNMFFELWLRFGALGLAVVLVTVLTALKALKIFAFERTSTWDSLMLSLFAFGLINGQTNLALEYNRVFWLGLAYFIHRRSSPITIGRRTKSWQTWKSQEYSRVRRDRGIMSVRD
jgi:O-antigen ligase